MLRTPVVVWNGEEDKGLCLETVLVGDTVAMVAGGVAE